MVDVFVLLCGRHGGGDGVVKVRALRASVRRLKNAGVRSKPCVSQAAAAVPAPACALVVSRRVVSSLLLPASHLEEAFACVLPDLLARHVAAYSWLPALPTAAGWLFNEASDPARTHK